MDFYDDDDDGNSIEGEGLDPTPHNQPSSPAPHESNIINSTAPPHQIHPALTLIESMLTHEQTATLSSTALALTQFESDPYASTDGSEAGDDGDAGKDCEACEDGAAGEDERCRHAAPHKSTLGNSAAPPHQIHPALTLIESMPTHEQTATLSSTALALTQFESDPYASTDASEAGDDGDAGKDCEACEDGAAGEDDTGGHASPAPSSTAQVEAITEVQSARMGENPHESISTQNSGLALDASIEIAPLESTNTPQSSTEEQHYFID
jgi:hypothetical protein